MLGQQAVPETDHHCKPEGYWNVADGLDSTGVGPAEVAGLATSVQSCSESRLKTNRLRGKLICEAWRMFCSEFEMNSTPQESNHPT